MFRLVRRPKSLAAGVRFCDPCADVSTAAQRAQRRYDRAHATAHLLISPDSSERKDSTMSENTRTTGGVPGDPAAARAVTGSGSCCGSPAQAGSTRTP